MSAIGSGVIGAGLIGRPGTGTHVSPLDYAPTFLSLDPNTSTNAIVVPDATSVSLLAPVATLALSTGTTTLAIPHTATLALAPGTSTLSLDDPETELTLDG